MLLLTLCGSLAHIVIIYKYKWWHPVFYSVEGTIRLFFINNEIKATIIYQRQPYHIILIPIHFKSIIFWRQFSQSMYKNNIYSFGYNSTNWYIVLLFKLIKVFYQ